MGQQQFLLLILSAVIAGLAVAVGLQAVGQGEVRANQDALINTAVDMAGQVQAKVRDPIQFGGHGGDFSEGSTLSLEELGYPTSSADVSTLSDPVYRTADGECGFADATLDGSIRIVCESADNRVEVVVDGMDSEDITIDKTQIKS